jgi:nitronate monooxygenase
MGVGVRCILWPGGCAEGGLGIVSSACIDRLVSKRTGKKVNTYEAVYEEVSLSKIKGGFTGINIMMALVRDFVDSVKGALDAGVDAIISGAGLPLNLPAIQPPKDTALIPIVSSARALDIICKKWEKLGYRPDAVVLGSRALDFDDQLTESSKSNLLPVEDIPQRDIPSCRRGTFIRYHKVHDWERMGSDSVSRYRGKQRHRSLQGSRRPGSGTGYRRSAPAGLTVRPAVSGDQAVAHVCLVAAAETDA